MSYALAATSYVHMALSLEKGRALLPEGVRLWESPDFAPRGFTSGAGQTLISVYPKSGGLPCGVVFYLQRERDNLTYCCGVNNWNSMWGTSLIPLMLYGARILLSARVNP